MDPQYWSQSFPNHQNWVHGRATSAEHAFDRSPGTLDIEGDRLELIAQQSVKTQTGAWSTNPASFRRKVLTDLERQQMCQYAEDHPAAKQTEIGGLFMDSLYSRFR